MSLEKITTQQMDAKGVCAAPDVLNGTPAQNKAVFDRMVRELIAPAYNAAVDAINAINQTESGIEAAEALRVSAENLRAAAETAREQAESGRVTAEEARVAAENLRAAAEELRAAAEQDRTAAEENRVSAENTRASHEAARAQAEAARQGAEQERADAETARRAAETARNVWEDYDSTKAYVPGNKVAWQGSSYVNISACTGITPTGNNDYWLLIARKGADGQGAGDMLAYVYDPHGKAQDVFAYADQKIPASDKGKTGGVASLGTDGKVPMAQLPQFAAADHTHSAADVGAAPSSHNHGASQITSGTLPVARGGTGQTTLTPAVATKGVRQIYAGTTDMTAGSSSLTTGCIYLVYE